MSEVWVAGRYDCSFLQEVLGDAGERRGPARELASTPTVLTTMLGCWDDIVRLHEANIIQRRELMR